MASEFYPILILAMAAFLDFQIGDPEKWLHPVQVMGKAIQFYTPWVFRWIKTPLIQKIAGILLAIGLIFCSGFIGWLIIRGIQTLPVPFPFRLAGQITLETILLASCFAGRSLRQAAIDVLQPLSQGNLIEARQRLSLYVGRDTQDLSTPEILRAVLETIGENATDGVMAPLFYALIGVIFSAIGSIPLTLAYKAASTLDSMVGYREPPYTNLGWFSAKLEDILTWLPCRLTVMTIAILSRKPRQVWQMCQRDAVDDPSPNSGWSECAYAAALGVQLGGTNHYGGLVKQKPLLGDPNNKITALVIHQALQLTRWSFLLWLGLFSLGYGIIGLN